MSAAHPARVNGALMRGAQATWLGVGRTQLLPLLILCHVLCRLGSMVSTITESCFLSNFGLWGQERLRSCNWLELQAANGLAIPYIGYLELDL